MVLAGLKVDNWGRVCEMYRPRKHTILPHYRPELLMQIKYIFTFVRRPVEYYISTWRFTTRSVVMRPEEMDWKAFDGSNPSAINEGVVRWKPDFEEWVEEMLEEEPAWMTRIVERFVGPHRGEFPHYIGRTETIEQDMERIMKIIGYEKEWTESKGQRNKIKHAKNRIRGDKAPHVVMNEELQERVNRSERVHIRRFFGEDTVSKREYRNSEGEPT
jgi:hypothetical protein